jgi:succinoglycan biosynthesis protein ExoM
MIDHMNKMGDITKISVCVCTYQRPSMLESLLKSLQAQKTGGIFTFDIIVVDNDAEGSAANAVNAARANSPIPIRYAIEPVPNISRARNRSLLMADGEFAACLDDDEFADELWLATLLGEIRERNSDGVLGPVLPSYEIDPPKWVIAGRLWIRESFPTGTILTSPKQTRSGNFMISKRMIDENPGLFDPKFGKLGGEDSDFFKRMLQRGYRLTWSNEARVYERIPPARLKRAYFLKRALLSGVVQACQAPLISFDTLKSLSAALLYSFFLPLLCISRPRWVMSYLIKDCHHVAKILRRCGVEVIRRRPG